MKILAVDEKFTYPDWPHGFTKRCQLQVWVEYKNKMGSRLVTQTTLEGRAAAPKKATYHSFFWLATQDDELYMIRLNTYDAKISIRGYGAKTPEVELDDKMINRIKAQLPVIQKFQDAYAASEQRRVEQALTKV